MRKERLAIIRNESKKPIRNRIYIATPTLGICRVEWAIARWGAVIPCNWSASGSHYGFCHTFPMGYLVADAQNVAVADAINNKSEWLFLLEDDILVPADIFVKLNTYMRSARIPIVSGLYYTKSDPAEPLVYRGRGNSYFGKWKPGEKIWVDGVPTGCLLIHHSILDVLWEESPEYQTAVGRSARKVFETPAKAWYDPETQRVSGAMGTSDLYWCDRIMKNEILEKAGWKKLAKERYPFLIDTSIFCKHIDLSSGTQYPILRRY